MPELLPNSTASERQPAYINIQLGRQEFNRFVDDITGEQEAVKNGKKYFKGGR